MKGKRRARNWNTPFPFCLFALFLMCNIIYFLIFSLSSMPLSPSLPLRFPKGMGRHISTKKQQSSPPAFSTLIPHSSTSSFCLRLRAANRTYHSSASLPPPYTKKVEHEKAASSSPLPFPPSPFFGWWWADDRLGRPRNGRQSGISLDREKKRKKVGEIRAPPLLRWNPRRTEAVPL